MYKRQVSTTEIITQLDNVLKKNVSNEELEKLISETGTTNQKNTEDSVDNNVTTVDEIFGEKHRLICLIA